MVAATNNIPKCRNEHALINVPSSFLTTSMYALLVSSAISRSWGRGFLQLFSYSFAYLGLNC